MRMNEPIKLCKCGKTPKIISNVDSFFKAYTIVCPACGRKKSGSTIDKVAKKWNRKMAEDWRNQQMSKDRITPCKYYIAFGECSKGREASQHGYCQKCGKYLPRIRKRYINKKKQKPEKIRKNERYD